MVAGCRPGHPAGPHTAAGLDEPEISSYRLLLVKADAGEWRAAAEMRGFGGDWVIFRGRRRLRPQAGPGRFIASGVEKTVH